MCSKFTIGMSILVFAMRRETSLCAYCKSKSLTVSPTWFSKCSTQKVESLFVVEKIEIQDNISNKWKKLQGSPLKNLDSRTHHFSFSLWSLSHKNVSCSLCSLLLYLPLAKMSKLRTANSSLCLIVFLLLEVFCQSKTLAAYLNCLKCKWYKIFKYVFMCQLIFNRP